jgi:hypothetical protein
MQIKQTELIKHNQIIVWKGFRWSKLFKIWDLDNIATLLIQLFTLSRYRHTAIYYKLLEKEYLIHSGAKNGMKIEEVTGEDWFKERIDNNIYDVYEYIYIHKKRTQLEREIQKLIMFMYEKGKKSCIFGSYNFVGIFNQLFFQLFDISPFQKTTNDKKMFCSELTNYYFTESENSFLYSPYAITDSNLYKKIR